MNASSPENTEYLAKVNQQILAAGDSLPAVTLKDGSKVQTGTVAAMLQNVKKYDSGERGEVEKELELAVATLIKVGLFDLFTPEEWVSGKSPGRRFVGLKAKEYFERRSAEA